jgi:hypothetical protein
MKKKPFISDIMSESKSTSYYNLRIAEWKLETIINILEKELNTIQDEIGNITTKSNLKNIIEELKLPF